MCVRFDLMVADTPNIELLQITDTHLFSGRDERLLGVNTYESARAVLAEALKSATPDLLLITGDIAQKATVETYRLFHSLVGEFFRGRLLAIPGNHDLWVPMREAGLATGRADLGAWSVIGVDTHTDGEVGGNLSDAEFERLDDELALVEARHVLLVGHHPPIAIDTPWLDAIRIANGECLMSWMRRRPQIRGYLFGHVHQCFDRHEEDLHLLGTPSTCFQFKPGSEAFAVDRRPPGYRTLTLTPCGQIRTRVYRLHDYDLEIDDESDYY